MADQKKRCLYEILNVARDASPEEIRSAYRRLALQLHPDKNPTASPAAFQELQHAYEVLSDPKERQFYDSHRSQILFSNPNPTSKSSSSSLFDFDLFSFFSTSAFSGFGVTGRGFFKVYGDVFGKIYTQELFFVKELGLDPDSVRPAPLIGNLESEYSQVTAFYNYWLGFCTVLDFGWVDEYDVAMGADRRTRRWMEEENKKKRKKARKEYNDLVRDLAAFAKKRDKRVTDMQVKKMQEEEKRREEEKKKKMEEARMKMERARMYEEQEWAKIDDEEEGKVFDEMGDKEEEGKGKKKEEFYCIVCNKKFKSDKQWKNHEQSKKHKDKVAELRFSFREEEEEEEEQEEEFESVDGGEAVEKEDDIVGEELPEDFKDFSLEEDEVVAGDVKDCDEKLESEDEESILEAMISGHKSTKSSYLDHDDLITGQPNVGNSDEENLKRRDSRKSRRNRAARRGSHADGYSELLSEEAGVDKKDEFEVKNKEDNREPEEETPSESGNVEEPKEEPCNTFEGVTSKSNQAAGKKNNKKQVDTRVPAKKDAKTSKGSSKGKKQKGNTRAAANNSCETCGENFNTRNKLFEHLGTSGHAALKSR